MLFQCTSSAQIQHCRCFTLRDGEYTMNIHSASFLLSAFASRTVQCVAPDSGPPEVVQTNKDRWHSCWLHQHVVHHGDQTGVLTSPSLLSQKTPGTAAKPNCNSILQAVSKPGTNKQNKIIITMMQGKASRRPVGLRGCNPGRLKCVCNY